MDCGFDYRKTEGLFRKIARRTGMIQSEPSDQRWTVWIRRWGEGEGIRPRTVAKRWQNGWRWAIAHRRWVIRRYGAWFDKRFAQGDRRDEHELTRGENRGEDGQWTTRDLQWRSTELCEHRREEIIDLNRERRRSVAWRGRRGVANLTAAYNDDQEVELDGSELDSGG
jgi:hypothetical protein